jgi:hypothetical protein
MTISAPGMFDIGVQACGIGLHGPTVLEKQQPFLSRRHCANERFRLVERCPKASRDVARIDGNG